MDLLSHLYQSRGINTPQRRHVAAGGIPLVVAMRDKDIGTLGLRLDWGSLTTMVCLEENAQLICVSRGVRKDKEDE